MYRSVYTGSMPRQMPPHAYVEWKGAGLSKNMLTRHAGFFVGCSCIYTWQMDANGGNLPTQLCLRNENSHCFRVSAHAYADCKISGQQPAQLHKEFPRTHEVGHSKDNDDAHFDSGSEFIKWCAAQNHVCVAMYLTQPLREMPSFPTQCLSGGNEKLKASDVESLVEMVAGRGHEISRHFRWC